MTQSCNDLTTLHGVVSEVVTVSICGGHVLLWDNKTKPQLLLQ